MWDCEGDGVHSLKKKGKKVILGPACGWHCVPLDVHLCIRFKRSEVHIRTRLLLVLIYHKDWT